VIEILSLAQGFAVLNEQMQWFYCAVIHDLLLRRILFDFAYRTHLRSFRIGIRNANSPNLDAMPHSSDLTDEEWDLFEPLLLEILPKKKQTRPSNWTKRDIVNGVLYQLKNGCNWCDLPKDLPPYSTVYWHYKQWRGAGVFEQLIKVLHEQVREQVKKDRNGQP
jgi:transposase